MLAIIFHFQGTSKIPDFKAVAGTTSDDIYFDHDWGFFSAVLSCYNNHWVLRTSPDDWWNVIVRNVSQSINDGMDPDAEEKEMENGFYDARKFRKDRKKSENDDVVQMKVRDFFVDHDGQKDIHVILPNRLDNINYGSVYQEC